jgi:predicted regulator of Ras-like GTPase activity (Roadblock/LC7/MglB family)
MSLRQIVDRWSARDRIRGAAIVSEDGLVIHDALGGGDTEAIAALAVTIVRDAGQFAEAAAGGSLRTVVLDAESGPAILSPIDARHTLVVLALPDRDLGPLLHEIRRERPALSQAV